MSDACLFCRMAVGEIPVTEVWSDDDLLAFADIDPKAPTHVLLIPRRHHPNAVALAQDDPELAARWLAAAGQVAEIAGIDDPGYRLVSNTGPAGGQTVGHVHLHILGGRQMQWPPG